jgi:hypothetical protein
MMEFIKRQIEASIECVKSDFTEFVQPREEGRVVKFKLEAKRYRTLMPSNPLKNYTKRGECSSAGNKNKDSKENKRNKGKKKRKSSATDDIIKDEGNKKRRLLIG